MLAWLELAGITLDEKENLPCRALQDNSASFRGIEHVLWKTINTAGIFDEQILNMLHSKAN